MHPRMVPESLDLQFAEMGCAGLGTTSLCGQQGGPKQKGQHGTAQIPFGRVNAKREKAPSCETGTPFTLEAPMADDSHGEKRARGRDLVCLGCVSKHHEDLVIKQN